MIFISSSSSLSGLRDGVADADLAYVVELRRECTSQTCSSESRIVLAMRREYTRPCPSGRAVGVLRLERVRERSDHSQHHLQLGGGLHPPLAQDLLDVVTRRSIV